MSQPFTTRAQAAAPPAELVEAMASAAYERSRFPGCTRPPWEQLEPAYRAEARADQVAAILAGVASGLISIASRIQPCEDAGSDIPPSAASQHSDGGRG